VVLRLSQSFGYSVAGGPTFGNDRLGVIALEASAVPGPIVGAGLPGLVMALGGLLAWRRRRSQAAAG
jgi:LPXTG-motif cell wall-anchored protein